jgi:hypothetical protein
VTLGGIVIDNSKIEMASDLKDFPADSMPWTVESRKSFSGQTAIAGAVF